MRTCCGLSLCVCRTQFQSVTLHNDAGVHPLFAAYNVTTLTVFFSPAWTPSYSCTGVLCPVWPLKDQRNHRIISLSRISTEQETGCESYRQTEMMLHEWTLHHCQLFEERGSSEQEVLCITWIQVIGERVSSVSTPTMISDQHHHHSHCVDTTHHSTPPSLLCSLW